MKTIKNRLLQKDYDVEAIKIEELDRYLRRIAYWIGQFIIEFNDLEDIVTNLLASRIHSMAFRGYEYIFLTGLMFNQKIELLERLFKYETNFITPKSKADELSKKASEVIRDFKDFSKIRNTIVHSNYYSLDKNGNIREKTKFTDADAEEHWVAITRDFIVENINRMSDLASNKT